MQCLDLGGMMMFLRHDGKHLPDHMMSKLKRLQYCGIFVKGTNCEASKDLLLDTELNESSSPETSMNYQNVLRHGPENIFIRA
jgi:hypothetical protein